jgi:hypothetical protein
VLGDLCDLEELLLREHRTWSQWDFVRADCLACGLPGIARLFEPVLKHKRVVYPGAALLHCLGCAEVSRFGLALSAAAVTRSPTLPNLHSEPA